METPEPVNRHSDAGWLGDYSYSFFCDYGESVLGFLGPFFLRYSITLCGMFSSASIPGKSVPSRV